MLNTLISFTYFDDIQIDLYTPLSNKSAYRFGKYASEYARIIIYQTYDNPRRVLCLSVCSMDSDGSGVTVPDSVGLYDRFSVTDVLTHVEMYRVMACKYDVFNFLFDSLICCFTTQSTY